MAKHRLGLPNEIILFQPLSNRTQQEISRCHPARYCCRSCTFICTEGTLPTGSLEHDCKALIDSLVPFCLARLMKRCNFIVPRQVSTSSSTHFPSQARFNGKSFRLVNPCCRHFPTHLICVYRVPSNAISGRIAVGARRRHT